MVRSGQLSQAIRDDLNRLQRPGTLRLMFTQLVCSRAAAMRPGTPGTSGWISLDAYKHFQGLNPRSQAGHVMRNRTG